MLLNWQSPLHMRAGLPNSAMLEAEIFYEHYLDALAGKLDEGKEDDVPWEAEEFTGELT